MIFLNLNRKKKKKQKDKRKKEMFILTILNLTSPILNLTLMIKDFIKLKILIESRLKNLTKLNNSMILSKTIRKYSKTLSKSKIIVSK